MSGLNLIIRFFSELVMVTVVGVLFTVVGGPFTVVGGPTNHITPIQNKPAL